MKIKEVKEMCKNENIAEVEIYQQSLRDKSHGFHGDFIHMIEEYTDDMEVTNWEVMGEDEYDETVLANGCVKADFNEWFGDKNAKVLVILTTGEEV